MEKAKQIRLNLCFTKLTIYFVKRRWPEAFCLWPIVYLGMDNKFYGVGIQVFYYVLFIGR
ncbi:hypothetical protein M0R19_05700 [Candidatus Pacearchaeota archaeon]|nr:hypothetical protein [Candidatus Pacearchaeota archaeon]